jgi:hypothetical protein
LRNGYQQHANDPEKAEYFVEVNRLDTVPTEKAINEVGLFWGNQNTVCQPSTPKWRHTVERLKLHFKKWDTKAGWIMTSPSEQPKPRRMKGRFNVGVKIHYA